MEFLNDISPWYWVAFGLALGALEMATLTFFLIWPALAALTMALVMVIAPSMSPSVQIATFSLMSIAYTFAGRYVLRDHINSAHDAHPVLNKRAARIMGRNADVLEFNDGYGAVEIDGMRWQAQWAENTKAKAGDKVLIAGIDGMVLKVEPSIK